MEPDATLKSCSRCAELEQRLAALEQQLQHSLRRIEQLEQNLREEKKQTVRFPKRQRQAQPKKPGRKGGHSQQKRLVPVEIERTEQAPVPTECPDCQIPFQITTHTQYQTDLPPVKPTTIEFQIQVGVCPCCGLRVQGRHPEQISDALGSANHVIGPQAQALAADLKHAAGVSYRKISRFFRTAFDLWVQPSTFVRSAFRLAKKAGPTVSLLWDQLRTSLFVHADETGWRIGTESAWLWVFCNDQITLFDIAPSRGHEVLGQNLKDFEGVLICDGLASYDPFSWNKQRCHAHLGRRIASLQEQWEEEDVLGWEFDSLSELRAILTAAAECKATRPPERQSARYREQVSGLKGDLTDWLEVNDPELFPDQHPEFQKLVRHVRKYQSEWLTFLEHAEVDRTNNRAERQIRWGVITRKLGGCNQSWSGSWKTRQLSSLVATCFQQSRNFLSLVKQLLQSRSPTAMDLNTLPAVG